jgi:transposase-like protein
VGSAARRFFEQAIEQNGAPEKVTIDKSGSNAAALEAINAGRWKRIVVRQVKRQTFFWPRSLPQERYNPMEPVPEMEIPV